MLTPPSIPVGKIVSQPHGQAIVWASWWTWMPTTSESRSTFVSIGGGVQYGLDFGGQGTADSGARLVSGDLPSDISLCETGFGESLPFLHIERCGGDADPEAGLFRGCSQYGSVGPDEVLEAISSTLQLSRTAFLLSLVYEISDGGPKVLFQYTPLLAVIFLHFVGIIDPSRVSRWIGVNLSRESYLYLCHAFRFCARRFSLSSELEYRMRE